MSDLTGWFDFFDYVIDQVFEIVPNNNKSNYVTAYKAKVFWLMLIVLTHSISLANNNNFLTRELPKKIVGTSDLWCPYTCQNNANYHGTLYDMVKKVIVHSGSEFSFHQTSWQRATELVKSDQAHILLGINKTHAERMGLDIYDQFSVPVRSVFLIPKAEKDKLTSESLPQYRLGHMKFYHYDSTGQWDEKLKGLTKSVAVNTHLGEEHLLTLLERNRIDVALVNENVAKAHLADTKLAEKYAIVDMDISIPIYIAFSRSEVGQLVKQAFAKNYQQLN